LYEERNEAMKRLTLSAEACVETLTLLVLMAHADGQLDDSEKAGVRAAADIFNLTKEFRDRLEQMMREPISVDQILAENLKPKERAFAFVAATWMAGVDANIDKSEESLLREVGVLFGFGDTRQLELMKIARDLEPGRKPDTSWSKELVALFKSIPKQIEEQLEGAGSEEIEVVFNGPGLLWD
jgi:uncharacterized tellurite resistance protein B-like protein